MPPFMPAPTEFSAGTGDLLTASTIPRQRRLRGSRFHLGTAGPRHRERLLARAGIRHHRGSAQGGGRGRLQPDDAGDALGAKTEIDLPAMGSSAVAKDNR